jgi:hypothetical protein
MEQLTGLIKQFEYYKLLGEKALDQTPDEALTFVHHAQSNSLAIIVKHLWGNMLSRWTDFLHSDGEKPWREREAEFEQGAHDRVALMQQWNEGWNCLFSALAPLQEADLSRIVYIRNQGHTVIEAIYRQLAHYAYHVGQMVFLARLLKGEEWQSLSIPKGKSGQFNAEKFSQEQHRAHFTDDFLNKT